MGGCRTPLVSMVTGARRAMFAYRRRAPRDVITALRRQRRPAPFVPSTNRRRRVAPSDQSAGGCGGGRPARFRLLHTAGAARPGALRDVLQTHRARTQRQPRPGARSHGRRSQRPFAVRLPPALQRLRAAVHGLRADHEAARRSGLAEHLQRPAVCHRGDGQGDPAHLRRQQERHGAAQAGDHPRSGAGSGVLGRDRAQRPHVTAAPRPPPTPPSPAGGSPRTGPPPGLPPPQPSGFYK